MTLLPDDASYLERASALFLALRGDGLALSPNDTAAVKRWHDAGVPFEVLRAAVERTLKERERDTAAGRSALRTLASCKRAVAAEMKRHLRLTAGAGNAEGETGAEPTRESEKQ